MVVRIILRNVSSNNNTLYGLYIFLNLGCRLNRVRHENTHLYIECCLDQKDYVFGFNFINLS